LRYLLESIDDLSDGVKVADVPASLKQTQNTRQNRLTIIMVGLIDDDMCHPRTYLQPWHISNTNNRKAQLPQWLRATALRV